LPLLKFQPSYNKEISEVGGKARIRSRNYTADRSFTVPVGHTSVCVKSIFTEYAICGLNRSKGKANPLQVCTGPESSIRLRLPDFKTNGTRRW